MANDGDIISIQHGAAKRWPNLGLLAALAVGLMACIGRDEAPQAPIGDQASPLRPVLTGAEKYAEPEESWCDVSEATCVGDDGSVCICTGKCEGGDSCECIAPNPFDDLPPPPTGDGGGQTVPAGSLAARVCALPRDGRNREFVADIIRTLGTNGEACFRRDGRELCVVKAGAPERPIRVGDAIAKDEALRICARTRADRLIDCNDAVAEFECNEILGGCGCSEIEDCLKMADYCGDETGGMCGDCPASECCCFP